MTARRFALLDRDGTIIVERHYLSDPGGVTLIDGAAAAIGRLHALGLGVVVVTNQSPIGRGIFDEARLREIHDRMEQLLAADGVGVDGIYHCPHTPQDGCECRKPRAAMATLAAADHGFDPAECFVVGDTRSDMGLARSIGARALLVRTGHGLRTLAEGPVDADHVVDDLSAAVECIAREL